MRTATLEERTTIRHHKHRATIAFFIQVHKIACALTHGHLEIPVVPRLSEHAPQLRAVIGPAMICHGVKYVDYALAYHPWLTALYDVCDGVHEPVASASGLRATGYSLHMTPQPWLHKHSAWVCNLFCHRIEHSICLWQALHARHGRNCTTQDEPIQLSTRLWS